jgi:hypothetical protein
LTADHFDLGQGPAIARRLRIGKILAQQIHVHPDDRQRILDLMRQRARQRRQLVVALAQLLQGLFGR